MDINGAELITVQGMNSDGAQVSVSSDDSLSEVFDESRGRTPSGTLLTGAVTSRRQLFSPSSQENNKAITGINSQGGGRKSKGGEKSKCVNDYTGWNQSTVSSRLKCKARKLAVAHGKERINSSTPVNTNQNSAEGFSQELTPGLTDSPITINQKDLNRSDRELLECLSSKMSGNEDRYKKSQGEDEDIQSDESESS